jgi:hypothetical protein
MMNKGLGGWYTAFHGGNGTALIKDEEEEERNG